LDKLRVMMHFGRTGLRSLLPRPFLQRIYMWIATH